jgi:8-oxo-dGTP diphosphatase
MPGPQAAVAIVHAREPESVLLIRRTEREEDPWSGHWSFPGGRRDPGDPDLVHTALRELAEECGIELRRESLDAALPPTMAGRRVSQAILVAPFLFRVETTLPTVLDEHEAAEALWIPLSVIRDPASHCLRPVPRVPQGVAFPAIELNGVPLWGFTYRVITEWLRLHEDRSSPEQAGFEAARLLLEFLLSHGVTLEHEWTEQPGEHSPPRRVAAVKGTIPVRKVLEHVSAPRSHFPAVSRLEVRPDQIEILGLQMEEYVIHAS